jgi:hypothetical protein
MLDTAKVYDLQNDLGGTAYCGPSAIAHLTGLPLSAAEDLIRRRRKGWRSTKRRITAVWLWEVPAVLKSLGCKLVPIKKPAASLGSFIDDTKHIPLPMLVAVGGHVCVVFKGTCTDDILRTKRRVEAAWTVQRPVTIAYKPLAVREPKAPPTKLEQAQRKLAAVDARRKAWIAKRKRAETAIRKLNESVKYYEGRVALLSTK